MDIIMLEKFCNSVSDEDANDIMVDTVAEEMRIKLQEKSEAGRRGWHNSQDCNNHDLKLALIEHIEKGDMIDVCNYAAMIYVRKQLYGEDA